MNTNIQPIRRTYAIDEEEVEHRKHEEEDADKHAERALGERQERDAAATMTQLVGPIHYSDTIQEALSNMTGKRTKG